MKGDPALAEKFQVQSNQAEQLLAKYRARTDKPNEIAALTDVGAVLIEYQRSLEQAVELTRRGLVPSEIDARIVVDDKPALAGLILLGRQIAADKTASPPPSTRLNQLPMRPTPSGPPFRLS